MPWSLRAAIVTTNTRRKVDPVGHAQAMGAARRWYEQQKGGAT